MTPERRHSVCALDCPDACALVLQVQDGRATRLTGDPDHPITRGFLCPKVARYLEREYAPSRLLYPQVRVGAKGEGRFARVTWDEALDRIAANLQRIAATHGPEAVLPYSYAGTMGLLNGSGMDRRFFHRFGASRLDRTICSSAGTVGLSAVQGVRYGTEMERFADARLILAWGANVLTTNPHLWPFIVEARRRGARFYTIDPIRTRTGQLADRHYAVYPGSDLALALGLLHVIFAEQLEDRDYLDRHAAGVDSLRQRAADYPPERVASLTGIPAEDIVALAREYATTRPAVIRVNYGIQRSDRGAAATQAIAMLPVVVGAWRDVGGGLQLSTSNAFALNRPALERADLQQASPLAREARLINMTELGAALTIVNDPPVQALVVYNSNPAAIAPDQNRVLAGFSREDLFTVVLDHFVTDTARYADVVLPATTFLEHTDLYLSYGHYYLQLARPALPAPGEARSNVDVFRELARRLHFTEPCFQDTDDDMIRTLLDTNHSFLRGITLERLDEERSIRLNISVSSAPFLPFAEGNFGFPDGKAQLHADALDYVPPIESRLGDEQLRARFPLELLSPKTPDTMNSTFGNRPDADAAAASLALHPADASARNIHAGDAVRVFNERGTLTFTAEISGDVRPGVVRTAAVRWHRNGSGNINRLISARLTDRGGGPTFYSCLVEVERCPGPASVA